MMIDPHLNHKVPHWNSFTIGSEIWAENSSYCFVKRSETKAERGKIEYVFSDGLLEKVNPSTADTVQELNACLVKTLEDVISRIETSEHWWMDEPGRGGFNVDYLKAVVRAAKGETE